MAHDPIMFGLFGPKLEGKPVHPDEFTWEHGSECESCRKRYTNQLRAYMEWHEEYYKCGS